MENPRISPQSAPQISPFAKFAKIFGVQGTIRALFALTLVMGTSYLQDPAPIADTAKPQIRTKKDPLCRTWYDGDEKFVQCLVENDQLSTSRIDG